MIRPDSIDALERDATEWAVRLDRGLGPEEQAELAAWTRRHPRAEGVLIRARAVLAAITEPDLVAANDAPDRRAPGPSRRGVVAGGALAAGFAGLAALFGLSRQGPIYETGRGQLRTVTLEDGSRVWLNTATRVRVRYSAGRRDVALLAGEALFDVAKDAGRPFVVRSGAVNVQAVGTSFSVSRLPDRPLEILVREGLVDVGADMPGAPPATRLVPGCRAHADQTGDVSVRHVGVPTVVRALAWRDGRLNFDSARLADAVDAFARHADPRIVLDTPGLADATVDGQFAANDPAAFARAMADRFKLRLTRSDGVLHLAGQPPSASPVGGGARICVPRREGRET